jgi:ribosomal protein S18 acetylase RimI-like enzyme
LPPNIELYEYLCTGDLEAPSCSRHSRTASSISATVSSPRRMKLLLVALSLFKVADASIELDLISSGRTERLEWRPIDNGAVRGQVRKLLHSSYVATPNDELRLEYSATALLWMLCAPGAREDLRIGVGIKGEEELIGFVCAVPGDFLLRGERHVAVEVSLLCVDRHWRGCGLAPVLLKELRRRASLAGVKLAIYTTAEPKLLAPLVRAHSFHRPLRPLALLRTGFWQPPEVEQESSGSASRERLRKLRAALREGARLPSPTPGPQQAQQQRSRSSGRFIRPMADADLVACEDLLRRRAESFALAPALSTAQFRHRFLSGEARSIVLQQRSRRRWDQPIRRLFGRRHAEPDDGSAGVRGFISFTLVPLRAANGRCVNQAVLLGYALAPAAGGDELEGEEEQEQQGRTCLHELMVGCMRAAKRAGAHVLNAHAIGELTPHLLESLGFGLGDAPACICLDGDDEAELAEMIGDRGEMIGDRASGGYGVDSTPKSHGDAGSAPNVVPDALYTGRAREREPRAALKPEEACWLPGV